MVMKMSLPCSEPSSLHQLSLVRTINSLAWHLRLSTNWFLYLSKLLCDDALHNPSASAKLVCVPQTHQVCDPTPTFDSVLSLL